MISQGVYGYGAMGAVGAQYGGVGSSFGYQALYGQMFGGASFSAYSGYSNNFSYGSPFQTSPQLSNAFGNYLNCAPSYNSGGQGFWGGGQGGLTAQGFGSYPPMGGSFGGGYGASAFGGGYGASSFGGGYGASAFGGGYGASSFGGGYGASAFGGGYGGAFGNAYGGAFGGSYGAAGGFVGASLQFGEIPLPEQQNKMWDVWFDSKDGQKTVQRSPIVLDLNGNGKADITGKNILGDGKIDGPTTLFDLDPNNVSYESKSQQRRPENGLAPSVKGGYWVDANGKKTDKAPPAGVKKEFAGYKYMDPQGNVVGEMKSDGLYHYGKQEKREITEWLAKDGGDGFLVADYNGDGQINDARELFGTEGPNGEKYKNGYEKLRALHDKNGDGKISGKELEGLQVWVDKNADGVVQEGELQSLKEHGITSFDVSNYNEKTMEGSYGTGGGSVPYANLSVVGGGFGSYGNFGGAFGGYNGGFAGGGFGGNFGGGFGGNQVFGGGAFGFNATWLGGYA